MERLTFKKWFEHFKPDEETTTIEVTGYTQIVECEDAPYLKQNYYYHRINQRNQLPFIL